MKACRRKNVRFEVYMQDKATLDNYVEKFEFFTLSTNASATQNNCVSGQYWARMLWSSECTTQAG